MFLYARPYSIICPVCETTMLAHGQSKYCCANTECRMYHRWFEIQLPIIAARACPSPLEA